MTTHVERTHRIELPCAPAEALALFTATGETRWVADWDPQFLHPTHPSDGPGTVFRTVVGGEETLWLVLELDRDLGSARYVRATPGSRLGTVAVRVLPAAFASTEACCQVEVTYALTALSDAGEETLSRFDDGAFAAMIEEWRHQILAIL